MELTNHQVRAWQIETEPPAKENLLMESDQISPTNENPSKKKPSQSPSATTKPAGAAITLQPGGIMGAR
ncbi:hypothetical protein [uncultured Corynebacterium sp.]|uniref:hypothetical protein n=1 Tax=uncultured Corynebacterium sp. TaxID=159447 RepID=UPI0025CE3CEE|nr:hypothetical protein [uncultured Corynebacterium sp.]